MASARTIKAGRAMVEIFADDSRLVRGLKRAQKRLETWGNNIQAVGRQAIRIGAVITAPLLATTRLFGQIGDQMAITADRTGVSVEALSELEHAAIETGSSAETLNAALFRMRRRIANAISGTGPAVRALDELGLSAEALGKLTTEEQLHVLSDALAGVDDESRAAQLAFEIFGDQAQALFPLLRRGSAGIHELRQEARDMSFTVSTQAAKAAGLFQRRLGLLGRTLRMTAFEVGAALAPAIGDVIEHMRRWVQAAKDFIAANHGLVVSALTIGTGLIAAGAGIVLLGAAVKIGAVLLGVLAAGLVQVGAVIGVAATMFSSLLSPIGLVVAALAVLGVAVARTTGLWATAVDWIGGRFGALLEYVRTVVSGIADALAAGDVSLAAKVLWAGLKLAWLKGTGKLREIWETFRHSAVTVATNAFYGIRGAWEKFRQYMEKNHPELTASLKKAWHNFAAGVMTVWRTLQSGAQVAFGEIIAFMDPDVDREAMLQAAGQDLIDELDDIEQKRVEAVAEADRVAGLGSPELDREHAERLAALEAAREEALRELNNASADRIDKAKERLEQAQSELDAALKSAREKRETLGDGEGPAGVSFDDLFDQIRNMVTDTADRVEVRGALGGQAIEQIVGGLITVEKANSAEERTASAAEQTAQATQETASETRRIADNTRAGGLVWGT